MKNLNDSLPIKIFYSYAHKDEKEMSKLRKYLKAALSQNLVEFWYDYMIKPGQEWNEEIAENLLNSQVVLFVVSDQFIDSTFIKKFEIPMAMKLYQENEALVIPIILRKCEWNKLDFAKLEALPKKGKPIVIWKKPDKAYQAVADGIREMVKTKGVEFAQRMKTEEKDQIINKYSLIPTEYFTGRGKILKNIRKSLLIDRKQVLCGLGGIGKTQTAVKYIIDNKQKYRSICWVHADPPQQLVFGLAALQSEIEDLESKSELSAKQKAISVIEWFCKKKGCLLVFDNADNPREIKDLVPSHLKCHILLTSRAQDFRGLGIGKPIEIEELTPEESVRFLSKSIGHSIDTKTEQEAVAELAERLGYLPLALEQAASYINQTKMPFDVYIEDIKKQESILSKLGMPEMGDYRKSVATTWILGFKKVKKESKAAADLLKFSAFLSPDEIQLDLLRKGACDLGRHVAGALKKANIKKTLVYEELSPLMNYSFIKLFRVKNSTNNENSSHDVKSNMNENTTRDEEKYSIHRVLQEVIKNRMRKSERKKWAKRTVRAVNRAFPEIEDFEGSDPILAQGLAVLKHIEDYSIESQESAELLTKVGIALFHLGRLDESEDSLKKACEIFKSKAKIRKAKLDVYGRCLNWLGILNRSRGHLERAGRFHESALAVAKKSNNGRLEAHVIANQGAVALWHPGYDPGEVNEYWKQSLEISTKIHDDYWIVHFGIDVGYMSFLERKFQDALVYLEKYTEIAKKNDYHENHARGLMNQGNVWFAKGKQTKALDLYDNALDIAEKQSVARLVWRIKHNIGNIYRKKKWFEKAFQNYNDAIKCLDQMMEGMTKEDKQEFIPHRAGPFYSMYLLYLDQKKMDKANKFAKTRNEELSINVKEANNPKVTSKRPNYFNGFFILTE